MEDTGLKFLFLRSIEGNAAAIGTALVEKLLTLKDLDEKNAVHRGCAFAYMKQSKGVEHRFIKAAAENELTNLVDGYTRHSWRSVGSVATPSPLTPVANAAKQEFIERVKTGNQAAMASVIQGYWFEDSWPDWLQNQLYPDLMDLVKTPDSVWASLQNRLPKKLAEQGTKERALTKRRKTLEEIKTGARQASVSSDPLIEAIRKKEFDRLFGINLGALDPKRWEKAKVDWLAAADSIKAHLVRLPWALVEPHAKEALTARVKVEGAGTAYHLGRLVPAWPIPKSVFFDLEPDHQMFWLKKMVTTGGYGSSGFEATSMTPFQTEEIREKMGPILVMEALQNSEVSKLFEWLELLRKVRKLIENMKRDVKGSLDKERQKMINVVLSGLASAGYGSGPLPAKLEEEGVMATIDTLNWASGLEPDEQGLAGRILLEHTTFKDNCKKVFGEELEKVTNFATGTGK